MVTLAEKQEARRAAAEKKFREQQKKKAVSLAETAERTAQRRGRGFDQLALVTTPPVAKAKPKPKPRTRQQQACDVLGGVRTIRRGQTLPRGVTFTCGAVPIQFNEKANNTTRRFFSQSISSNQAKLRAAGFGDFIPASQAEINNAKRAIKIARRKRQFGKVLNLQIGSCKRFRGRVVGARKCSSLRKEFPQRFI